jgi:hypothetical protein
MLYIERARCKCNKSFEAVVPVVQVLPRRAGWESGLVLCLYGHKERTVHVERSLEDKH